MSGFLVKFGVVGIIKAMALGGEYSSSLLIVLSIMGLLNATMRLIAQVDLKRIIAALTIIETNWMVLCFAIGTEATTRLGCGLVLVHCFTTTAEFYLVESIYRRFHTRSITSLSGIFHVTPILGAVAWCVCLVIIGLPLTSIFAAKIIFFSSVAQAHTMLFGVVAVIFFVVLPVAVVRVFSSILGGTPHKMNHNFIDLSSMELRIFAVCLLATLVLGLFPALIM